MNVLQLLLVSLTAGLASPPTCRVSEYYCDTGQCVALDRYCDGIDDCPDKSDEPRYCSPCNRTYFGDVGRTYELEIRRPREDRLPFLCHINFTAGGGELGDLVQLTFDTFTVGKFVSFTSEGCPDGHMSIRETERPDTLGQWCGSAWGYTVYYSEGRSINLTLLLDKLSEQGIGYNFDFKLAYKFLRRAEAHLRYGNSTALSYRGELMPTTYCDRVLEGCDRRPCRIQSPNYPGVYPRNVTCYYRVEQRQAPRGKHVLLAVRQRNSHKIHIKDQIVKYDRSQRVLRVWDQCNVVQDYLTVYDGPSTLDPVLVRLCGGDVVPDIISSGPNMLLEFHTSPYDNPFHPVPLSYLPGFELEVQVLHVESRSHQYIRDGRHCEFLLTSFDSPWGELQNPRHSLPPNTTCRYHFQGKSHETVWLSFVKYHAASADPAAFLLSAECNARLRIWDGRFTSVSGLQTNVSLIGEFCKDEVPRLCDHSLLSNSSRFTRPCSLAESYVSSGSELTLELFLKQGSVLFPLNFLIRYEFVDMSQEGGRVKGSENPCDRVFSSSPNSLSSGRFQSPRSVFYYGRGGSQNISCVVRFEPSTGERVRLTFTRARFGERQCRTEEDSRTGRYRCDVTGRSPGVSELWVSEHPWPGVQLPRDCLCSKLTDPVTTTFMTGSVVEVNFTVTFMNITQDFSDFHFEGDYQFVSGPAEAAGEACTKYKEERRLRGSSGELILRSPSFSKVEMNELLAARVSEEEVAEEKTEPSGCSSLPWLIEPEDYSNNFLYVKIRGYELPPTRWRKESYQCDTANRILVYAGVGAREPRVVCPTGDPTSSKLRVVEVFSDGWNRSSSLTLLTPHARSFVVEFLQKESGSYSLSWMEVSKRPLLTSSSSFIMTSNPMDCPYRCPELNACISAALWCDGQWHCPSGYDESEANCAFQFGVPLLYVAIGAGSLLVLTFLTLVTACLKFRQHRRNRRKKRAARTANQNHHNHLNHHHNHLNHEDLYTTMEGKDSLC